MKEIVQFSKYLTSENNFPSIQIIFASYILRERKISLTNSEISSPSRYEILIKFHYSLKKIVKRKLINGI